MLVLGRRVGEKITIDESITITLLSMQGNQVKIGISAPKEVNIVRNEIMEDNHNK
jgi:carbon storage regulator